MKNIEPQYMHDWSDSKREGMLSNFEIKEEHLNGINVLLASYNYEGYSGDAFVLFEKDGKLYEVNGSHCSCYGLEGQWEPEETTIEALRHRMMQGTLGKNDYHPFAVELEALLNQLEAPEEGIYPSAGEQKREPLAATAVYKIYKDGDKWCAVDSSTFIDLQQSQAGWGSSPSKALADLLNR